MHICVLVGDVKALKPRFGSVHLAWSAHRRGHDVHFVSADDLSYLNDNSILGTTTRARAGDYARPADYLRGAPLLGGGPGRRGAVALRRGLPALQPADRERGPRRLAGHRSLLAPAPGRHAGDQRPRGRPAGGQRHVPGRSAGRGPGAGAGLALARRGCASSCAPSTARRCCAPCRPRGGEKVFYVRRRQKANVNQMISALTKEGYAVAQEYPPEAEHGEKRDLAAGRRADPHRRPTWRSTAACPCCKGGLTDTIVETPERAGAAASAASSARSRRACARSCAPSCWPTGSTSCRSIWWATKYLDSTCSRPSGLRSLSEIYGVEVGEIVIVTWSGGSGYAPPIERRSIQKRPISCEVGPCWKSQQYPATLMPRSCESRRSTVSPRRPRMTGHPPVSGGSRLRGGAR